MLEQTKELDKLTSDFSLADLTPVAKYLPLSKANKALLKMKNTLTGYIDEVLEEHKKNFNKGKAKHMLLLWRPGNVQFVFAAWKIPHFLTCKKKILMVFLR